MAVVAEVMLITNTHNKTLSHQPMSYPLILQERFKGVLTGHPYKDSMTHSVQEHKL